jgi:UDP-GlcNAc:undecaprenyl-phosphate GlcNAc-1-phosphate transferase
MPAKMFLGDAGSLFLGFLMSVGGIYLLNKSRTFTSDAHIQYLLPVILIACFMIPVIDTLRVFIGRVQKGKSPFSPDKTHLHHKIIKLINLHNIATIKIVYLHAFLILLSLIAGYFIRISTIALLFIIIILSFTQLLNFAETFTMWYKKIKRIENGLD